MIHIVKDFQTATYYFITRRLYDDVTYQLDTFVNGKAATIDYEIVPCGDRDENSAAEIKKITLKNGTEIKNDPEWDFEFDCLSHYHNLQQTIYLKTGQIL